MKQIDLREGARRQHRGVALFAVIQCWMRKIDGVAFRREELERLLGLVRFKRTRVRWLKEDLEEFFPKQRTFWSTGQALSFSALIVSRESLAGLPNGTMTTESRLRRIGKGGPKIGLFKMWDVPKRKALETRFQGIVPFFADEANYDERFLSAYLALLAEGQISPHNLPPLRQASSVDRQPVVA